MIRIIRELLAASPFVPFDIVTSGTKAYSVPTADHADVSPKGGTVVVWFDDDSNVSITGLHIVSIERPGSPVATDS